MGKFQGTPILELIDNLTENITPADVDMSYGHIMRTTNVGKSLIDIGKSFIPSDSSPLGKKSSEISLFFPKIQFFQAMISRYFVLSGIPMSRITICEEIRDMASFLVKNIHAAKSNSISAKGNKKFLLHLY